MPLDEGTALLRGRYELGKRRSAPGDAEAWIAYDEDGVTYLARTWAYDGDEPDPVQRALWDAELRTLYKVASSPGADDTLVVLEDAGLDRDAKSFVMVLRAPGYDSVANALDTRAEHSWLSSRDPADRRELWRALARVAAGLAVLHSQHVLHRDVGAAALLYLPDEPTESVRLGGFEWSVRLGRPLDADPPVGWSSPPERLAGDTAAWRPDDDWFGFGMLCTRLVLNLERYANNAPTDRYNRVLKAIETARTTLTEPERALLMRLVDPDPLERMVRPHDVQLAVREIIALLAAPPAARSDDRPFTLIVNPKQVALYDYLLDRGLREHLGLHQDEPYDPRNTAHTDGLAAFLRRDLDGGSLYAVPKQETVVFVGRQTIVRLGKYSDRGEATWRTAFCLGPAQLKHSEGGAARVRVPAGRLAVRSTRAAHTDRGLALASAPWDPVLPRIERGAEMARDLAKFHQFVRATHQLELLMLDATIFPIELVAGPEPADEPGFEHITVRERSRPEHRQVLPFLQNDHLAGFLHRELEAGKPDSGSVILSGEQGDALALPTGGKDNQWRVHAVGEHGRTATLRRPTFDPDRPPPPDRGFLRGAGMPGQLKLIRRRKQAIDTLDGHSYLLRSLAAPGQVYMDTGAGELPVDLAPKTVDKAKRRAIEDILRVRPIFALQGPPGTGKTTLVAWLLREILHDDPVAQVLVTAQAHGAVDVLRARVTEAFEGVPPERRPLAVRLGSRRDDDTAQDTVEDVALQVLRDSSSVLASLSERTPAQQAWLEQATAMAEELASHEARGTGAADFVELVKRGANLTYSTTSAGELEAIAADQSFDWSIVEEAGKAHGFDLALPLQAGHRWLLIGDHNQLPPYRYEDYLRGLDALDEVVEALQGLPDTGPGVLDWEWVSIWKDKSAEERADFQNYAKDWLKTFKRTFEHCQVAVGRGDAGRRLTDDSTGGAAAGVLVEQHRMHPDIGKLISRAYYDNALINRTAQEDGTPAERVQHAFVEPVEIRGKAIVWLDVPWCHDDPRTAETGPVQGRPRYTNVVEAEALERFLGTLRRETSGAAELAVLSPYNQQASLLRRRMREAKLPAGLKFKPALNERPGASGRAGGVHTVDSFQGNQADVIAVSLVRNNVQDPGHGLGFLNDASRLNVLLSRAEQLLVLVGSWDFFKEQVRTVELDDAANPLWHLKRIVTDLEDWFDSGRAVRIGAEIGGHS